MKLNNCTLQEKLIYLSYFEFLEGISSSKVWSMLSYDLLKTELPRISYALVIHVK